MYRSSWNLSKSDLVARSGGTTRARFEPSSEPSPPLSKSKASTREWTSDALPSFAGRQSAALMSSLEWT